MDNPKVSIIVPIYRVEEYIERCAESLFAQTFDDIEYIFVDDCSQTSRWRSCRELWKNIRIERG